MKIFTDIEKEYLYTNIDNFKLTDFAEWFTNKFKNKKYKVNKIKIEDDTIFITIIKDNQIFELFNFKLKQTNNIICDVEFDLNTNLIILEDDNFLNNFFAKEKD